LRRCRASAKQDPRKEGWGRERPFTLIFLVREEGYQRHSLRTKKKTAKKKKKKKKKKTKKKTHTQKNKKKNPKKKKRFQTPGGTTGHVKKGTDAKKKKFLAALRLTRHRHGSNSSTAKSEGCRYHAGDTESTA